MILDLQQGSPAWQEWRRSGLGGSDAATILAAHEGGRGARKDLDALLGAKLAPPVPARDYPDHWRPRTLAPALAELVRRGTAPPSLRPRCVQHPEIDWLRATLGGLDWLGVEAALSTSSNIAEHEAFLAGELPWEHQVQAQHCLLASGAELLWSVSTSERKRFAPGERWAVVEVRPCAETMARLAEAEEAFMGRLALARRGLAATA